MSDYYAAGSFLDVVAHAHPNQDVRCGQYVSKASNVARDVRHMIEEMERLRVENTRLSDLVDRLTDHIVGSPDR